MENCNCNEFSSMLPVQRGHGTPSRTSQINDGWKEKDEIDYDELLNQ